MTNFMWIIPVLAYAAHYGSAFAYKRVCTWSTIGSPMCTFLLTVMFNSNAHIAEMWFIMTSVVLALFGSVMNPCKRNAQVAPAPVSTTSVVPVASKGA